MDYKTGGSWKKGPESYRIYKILTQNRNIWKQDQGGPNEDTLSKIKW